VRPKVYTQVLSAGKLARRRWSEPHLRRPPLSRFPPQGYTL